MTDKDITYYQRLAVRYLEGKLDYTEEEILFRFIKETPENEQQFRTWEAEWLTSPEMLSPETDQEWKRLKQRMRVRDGFAAGKRWWHSWSRVAAVIGGVVVLMTAFTGIRHYQNRLMAKNIFKLETERAEKTRLMLADGTTVYLNAQSTLCYTGDFNNGQREVRLSGEAYFEVAKQEDVPFVVKTDSYDVVVKGTKFNVSAYQEDPLVTTTLLDGSVDIRCRDKQILLEPGEQVSLNKKSSQFSKERVQAEQYKSWTEGRFEYDKISFRELAERLSRKYDVDIHLDESVEESMAFRISLRNEETVDDILQALAQIAPIGYEKKEREVHIWKK